MAQVGRKQTRPRYNCVRCGELKDEGQFYKSRTTDMWKISDGKVLICKVCANEVFEGLKVDYTEEQALLAVCGMLDIAYIKKIINNFHDKGQDVHLGKYIVQLNNTQYSGITFLESLLSDDMFITKEEIMEKREVKWSRSDKQNKNHVISSLGYDPFEDQYMQDDERKEGYNTLSGYLDMEGVLEDQHKIKSVIELTQLHLQVRRADELINKAYNEKSPDVDLIKDLQSVKNGCVANITKLSKDNNIGSQYNTSNSTNSNTLTGKMKLLNEEGINELKVNLFDIKTAAAMQQISDLSVKSIAEQLNFDAGDYAQMIKDQREMINKWRIKSEELEEENRILKNKIESMVN